MQLYGLRFGGFLRNICARFWKSLIALVTIQLPETSSAWFPSDDHNNEEDYAADSFYWEGEHKSVHSTFEIMNRLQK